MWKFILLLFLSVLLFIPADYAQSYGLRFSSHEAVQEKRTSLDLTSAGSLCIKKNTSLSFNLNFLPYKETYFGYVVRIITDSHQNIDLVYNQKERTFNFLIGENYSTAFVVDSAALFGQWTRIGIAFDVTGHQASVSVNGRTIAHGPVKLQAGTCMHVFFGTNTYEGFQTVDIPPMNIRDIQISEEGQVKYKWPLSENDGHIAVDVIAGKKAAIRNADWIGPKHRQWRLLQSWEINGNPSVAFDRDNEVLYVVSRDSLYDISFKQELKHAGKLSQPLDSLMPGNQSVFNPFNHRLYNYYIDHQKAGVYDTVARKWDVSYAPDLLTVFWQANKFVSRADSSLYVLLGYGQLQYKNKVQRYRLADKQWDSIATTGERITPRYLAAVGATPNGDTAYVLGGYGSNSGNQVVNPRHYYDLVRYVVKDRAFHKIYQLPDPPAQFCFANSLVLDADHKTWYALIFPDDKFNTALQLIRGSLETPGYTPLAGTIPYSFHDIKSFADLYYCKDSKQLVAVTLYTSKDNMTTVKVYTLEFPPELLTADAALPVSSPFRWYYLLVLPVLGLLVWWWKGRRPQAVTVVAVQPAPVAPEEKEVLAEAMPEQEIAVLPEPGKRGHVFFFGPFEVQDKEGQDVTRFFTPLLKELFLLISIHTLRTGKGISSERLYATLWRDKSNKEAQNNRSVNMVKLKAILDKLGACAFVKEADRWSLQYAPSDIRMDLADFQQLLQAPRPFSKDRVRELLGILRRGAFLPDAHYTWLEDIQSEISNAALTMLTDAAEQFPADAEFLIEIADSIFLFDLVNEEALRLKCSSLISLGRHSLAKAAFNKFTKEYLHMYGEEFPQVFTDFSGDK
ncbi:galactose oxidase [Chitinophaga eiseniae]|uniref:Galactose oxidase n=1 Tax=Chitinophaga eiseniae TaxID=634771 RepID=A0A847S5Z3_9BACT|nr:galactose oxidase [Chitinophaga eiseniae]NLR77191.1 galactose oxidase [Chitinophaga eiseniae]